MIDHSLKGETCTRTWHKDEQPLIIGVKQVAGTREQNKVTSSCASRRSSQCTMGNPTATSSISDEY